MNQKEEEVISAVLSALRAEEILDSIRAFLEQSGERVSKKALLDIIQKGEEADEYYS